jgi:hypothetical protein
MEWIILWIGINAVIGYAIGRSKNDVGNSRAPFGENFALPFP